MKIPNPPTPPTPEEIKAFREKFGLSQAEFSRLLGVNQPCVANWEKGIRKPQPYLGWALKALASYLILKQD